MRPLLLFFLMVCCCACGASKGGTKVLRPKNHKSWPKGHAYLIDIPVGTRHIHWFKRRTTKTVSMK